ncbi:hypothetical protein C9374_012378 [Naegleria lovaniensis]|uniref:Enkurin domain-containing protein n=1 Tax=Naegleria lovaniensis TaxID=51637 RepID=A0AA88H320_NAELO|nr:uncharacterized protein C9374_012378 [Naegleria lovaniensis]KAG2392126.1 hypothetical protein C9374_012378 [Naegleria lovaniensis]
MLQNLKSLREKEHENKLKKETESIKKEEFKLPQYKEVESKVKQIKEQDYSPENPVNENYLRSGAMKERVSEQALKKKEIAIEVKREKELIQQEFKKPAIPKKEATPPQSAQREEKNYLVQNATKDLKMMAKKGEQKLIQKKDNTEYEKPETFGRVPKYILERKAEWQQQEEKAMEEQRKRDECPPGMKLVSEHDRIATLSELERNKKEIQGSINRMPILCDTMSLQQKKAQLERKLEEIEDAIKIFSRKKVYIAED